MTRVVAAGAEGARSIIDAARFMTLATADADGTPWACPVWFATAGYSELVWVSSPDARHSRNLAARSELGIVIFDSTVTPGEGQAVYMAARAEQLEGDALAAGLAAFNERSVAQLDRAWGPEDVREPARHRLYRAVVSEHWMLREERDERVPVSP
jgi:nitroimidazol reductase NimA-like FMN-containing flavoprotein (pyridoxamine 5'-phosphate oxidase superfamily)